MGDDHSLPLFYQNFLSPVSEAMLDGAHSIHSKPLLAYGDVYLSEIC